MNKLPFKLLWFFLGLGSQLQVVASLSFSEIFVYIAGPLLFWKERIPMKRNGIMPLFWLSICLVVNALISCGANGTHPSYVLRGMAVVCLIPCVIVVSHWMLRKDLLGYKWWLLGYAISGVLCVFVFQKSVEVTSMADGNIDSNTAAAIMSGSIFWISRVGWFVDAITKGWYMQLPIAFSILLPLGFAAFSIFSTASGRSAALGAVGVAVIVLLGGKSRSRIYKYICSHFMVLCMAGALTVFAFKVFYETASSAGWLGEEARNKYEVQTHGDKSIGRLLLGGRMEAFCGLIACVDKPIIGFGPWALDEYGYVQEFLSKYADDEDYQNYLLLQEYYLRMGFNARTLIPGHSYITMFWLWYGIFGLVFWLYVIFVIIRYLKQDCYAMPHWFMWLAGSIPGYLWGVFFSPFSDRIGAIMFVVAILIVRSIRKGTMILPNDVRSQIEKYEKRW